MILFQKDWARYPTASLHLETSNRSFVRICQVLKEMGVKNHAFPLTLVDPELRYVDPFSDKLTDAQITAIITECTINPWYFLRECLRAPSDSGADDRPVEANRANIALWWCFLNHLTFWLIQPRQTGKSFNTDGLMTWLLRIRCRNTKINLLTKNDNLRRENIKRLKAICEALPKYLQSLSPNDAQNGEEISVSLLGNHYGTHVPRTSIRDANNMGRGLTSAIMHIDEPPFQAHIDVAVQAMLAASGAAVDNAKSAGAPYGFIFTTTAGKKNDPSGKWVYEKLCQAAEWDDKFYDCEDVASLYATVDKRLRGGTRAINATFSHRQLGKTDEWLREKMMAAMQEGENAERDYLNRWTSGNERSPFTPEQTERINNSLREKDWTEMTGDNYMLKWYYPEHEIANRMADEHHVMGIDPSDAVGRDAIGIVMCGIRSMGVAAVANVNESNLITFAKWLVSMMVKYPKLTVVVERKSSGAAILDYLFLTLPTYGIDPYRRVFNRVVNEADIQPERFREIEEQLSFRHVDITNRYRVLAGFPTGSVGQYSRNVLYGQVMTNAIKRAGHRIADSELIAQLMGLVIRNDRIDHDLNSHDDLVIAWLLAHWLIQSGGHLKHYGIPVNEVYSEFSAVGDTAVDVLFRKRMKEIKVRIDLIIDELSKCRDDYMAQMLEHQLRVLHSKYITEDEEIMSLEELIKTTREKRLHDRQIARQRQHWVQPRPGSALYH